MERNWICTQAWSEGIAFATGTSPLHGQSKVHKARGDLAAAQASGLRRIRLSYRH